MKDKKIIFMGTPDIAAQHLNILIEKNFNIVGVFTQPPRKKNRGMRIEKSDVHQIAEKNDIEVFYPTSIDDTVIEQVKSLVIVSSSMPIPFIADKEPPRT